MPPTLENLLLEDPLPLIVGFLGITLVMRLIARRRGEPRYNYAAAIALMLAGVVFGLSSLVTTPREQLMKQTRALVAATESGGDLATLRRMIDPDVTFTGPHGDLWWQSPQVHHELEQILRRYTVADQRVIRLDAELRASTWGVSMFDVRTQFEADGGLPHHTRWALRWEKSQQDDQWRVVDIRWMTYRDQPPSREMLRL